MCDHAVDNYAYALESVLDCYKTHEMCNKSADTYPFTIQFVPSYYKTLEMCDKAVNACFLYFILFLINTR